MTVDCDFIVRVLSPNLNINPHTGWPIEKQKNHEEAEKEIGRRFAELQETTPYPCALHAAKVEWLMKYIEANK